MPDDDTKATPRRRAAAHARPEEEAHATPRAADLLAAIRSRVEPLGGVDLDLPPRTPPRVPTAFEEDAASGPMAHCK